MGKYSKFNSFKGVKWPWVNRKYKDTVFRLLFSKDRRALLDLYNAINNSHYDNPDELIVNTLESAIFMGMRNDLSFILDTSLNVYEHQSTKCPNIPLRCLLYVSSLYQQILDESSLYSSKRLQIPEPHFVVFYNGTEDFPEETSYKLSEMYEGRSANPELELTVKVLNINQGMNKSLMQSCVELNGYSIYVAKVREFSQTMSFKKAVNSAVDYCIENDILRDFMEKERKAVIMYSLTRYNQKGHMKVIREEALEDGIAIGEERGIAIGEERGIAIGREKQLSLIIENMLSLGKSPEEIAESCSCSIDEVTAVINKSKELINK